MKTVIKNKNYGVSLWSYIHFKVGTYMIKKKCDFTAFHNFIFLQMDDDSKFSVAYLT